MAQLGITKRKHAHEQKLVRHKHEGSRGGTAYEFNDPLQRLLATIGGTFFNEPTFYGGSKKNKHGLTGEAMGIITDMETVAKDNPEDLFILARYARETLNLRTTSHVAVAIATRYSRVQKKVINKSGRASMQWLGLPISDEIVTEDGKRRKTWRGTSLAARYIDVICVRLDDMMGIMGAYQALCTDEVRHSGRQRIPHAMLKGFRARLARASAYEMLKYQKTGQHPSLADVMLLVQHAGGGVGRRAVDNPTFEYVVNGVLMGGPSDRIGMFDARERLLRESTVDGAIGLLRDAGATWELVSSQFGRKKEVWEALINKDCIPPFALLQNVRNILQIKVDGTALDQVCESLAKGHHRILPFRYISALRAIGCSALNAFGDFDSYAHDRGHKGEISDHAKSKVSDAISRALDRSVESIAALDGRTLLMVDCSGSMNNPVSDDSTMTMTDAGLIMAAMWSLRSGAEVDAYIFAGEAYHCPFRSSDGVLHRLERLYQTAQKIKVHSTTAHVDVMEKVMRDKTKYDRIIVITDMCAYGKHVEPDTYWGGGFSTFSQLTNQYRGKINPQTFAYGLNFSSSDQTQLDPEDTRTIQLSGWSEKILDFLNAFENQESAATIDMIRQKWGLPEEDEDTPDY